MTAKKNDKPKRRRPDPIPIVGVRGSGTKISAPKAVLAGSAIALVAGKSPGETLSPIGQLGSEGGGLDDAIVTLERRVIHAWNDGRGKLAVGLLAGLALFGKAIDKRTRDFPIKFGG